MGKYVKGLFKDNAHIDQPSGTWRYAKNMQIHPVDGALSNEHGFQPVFNMGRPGARNTALLSTGSIVIGQIPISNNRIILFIAFDEDLTTIGFQQDHNSEIGLFDGDTYTVLYQPNRDNNASITSATGTDLDLNFSIDHFIEGTFKENPEGEIFVYWTDGLNPPRTLNVTRQLEWLNGPNGNLIPNTEYLYGIDYTNTPNTSHIRMLDLFPSAGNIPHVEFNNVTAGGNLKTGIYHLALAYVDRDLVATNYVTLSNPISIVEDFEGVLPIERYDGAPGNVPSGKSINWRITNLNTDYEYIRPVVIKKSAGVYGTFQLSDIPVDNLVDNNTIAFTGLEGYTEEANVNDVIIDTVGYDTAKTINQLDSVLYLGHVSGSKDVGYQPYANFIKAHPVLHPFPYFDPHEATEDVLQHGYIQTSPTNQQVDMSESRTMGYRHNLNIAKYKGYTRDEVYAFYIAFIMHDGTESYAYHIPGRPELEVTAAQANTIPSYSLNTSILDIGSFESGDIYPDFDQNVLKLTSNHSGRIFHYYETSMFTGARNMNFWQNTNEFYPVDELNQANWDIIDASQEFGEDYTNSGVISGDHVRHHHFPSNENERYQTVRENTSDLVVELDVKGVFAIEHGWCSSRGDYSGSNDSAGGSITAKLEDVHGVGGGQVFTEINGVPMSNSNFESQLGNDIIMLYELDPNGDDTWWPDVGGTINWYWCNSEGSQKKCGAYGIDENNCQYTDDFGDCDGIIDCGELDSEGGGPCWAGGAEPYVFEQSRNTPVDGIVNSSQCPENFGFLNCIGNLTDCWTAIFTTGCIRYRNNLDIGFGSSMGWRVWAGENCHNLSGSCNDGAGGPPCSVVHVDKDFNYILLDCPSSWVGDGAPNTGGNFESDCHGWIAWREDRVTVEEGSVGHYTQALGIQFEDLKVPQHIWENTQGFRIYYAKREHHDRRILGQSIMHPYALTIDKSVPMCNTNGEPLNIDNINEDELDNIFSDPDGTESGLGFVLEKYWVNLPYQDLALAYPIPNEDASLEFGYQGFSFHDFYLSRGHGSGDSGGPRKSIAAATHIKLDYIVEMLPFAGPGVKEVPVPDCYMDEADIVSAYLTGFNYWNPNQAQSDTDENGDPQNVFDGGTGELNLYQWLQDQGTTVDLNRPVKERCKTYLNGDNIFNGKQLGFGYKTYNILGESHISLLLDERGGILPAFSPNFTQNELYRVPWVVRSTPKDDPFLAVAAGNNRQPYFYTANLHAFRLDMYKPIDRQDLVWTGYEVTGSMYDCFKVDDEGNPIGCPDIANNPYGVAPITVNQTPPNTDGSDDYGADETMSIEEYIQRADVEQEYTTAHIFGGDTFLTRYGYRKTLRNNLDSPDSNGSWFQNFRDRDVRFIYHTIVESTDNINFRHVVKREDSYFPGTPAKDIITLKNRIDLTDVDNMAYNEDYSSVNDIGSTQPLPLQISQPTLFPTRVIRSVLGDDSSLRDAYRMFLALDFNDLPKNRGDLWKISVFNNLLYFHMEESILRTKGKQVMEMKDGSEAFVGSGDLFAQAPEEILQTTKGYGGTQSQFATCVGEWGYFYVDQKNLTIYLLSNELRDISSLGLNKWFQANLPYKLSTYGLKSFPDNPYTFGFTSVYDEKFNRILLTKRELAPTSMFIANIGSFNSGGGQNNNSGIIRYNSETDTFEIRGPRQYSLNAEGDIQLTNQDWQPMRVTTDEQTFTWLESNASTVDEGFPTGELIQVTQTYFVTSGWTVSYSTSLNAWISFHDYVPYLYTSSSNNVYSFRRNPFPTADDVENITRNIWMHNWPSLKGVYYGQQYNSEVEVIHNEMQYVNKLFYNFCWISDYTAQALNNADYVGGIQADTIGMVAGQNNNSTYEGQLLATKTHAPGFDQFVVYNSHQVSGLLAIEELVNTRKNGCEWCINKFRDISIPGFNFEGIEASADQQLIYDLFNPVPGWAQDVVIQGVDEVVQNVGGLTIEGTPISNSIPPLQRAIWLQDGMNETLSPTAMFPIQFSAKALQAMRPRKFIDKWLAIRLITSNSGSFLVNLYSTEVGIRKFPRHEQKGEQK